MDVQINVYGVLAAVAVSMVIGSLWYSKSVFGKSWAKLVKLDEKRARKEMPKAMIAMLLMAGVTAYVLAHVTFLSYVFFGQSYLSTAMTTAFWMWLGFAAPIHLMLGIFEQRDVKLVGISLGHSFVSFMAMGIAIGLVGL